MIGISSCANGAPKLDWHGTIWSGDSALVGVVGKKEGKPVIQYCQMPDFDKFTCLTNDDFAALIDAENRRLLQCEKWK